MKALYFRSLLLLLGLSATASAQSPAEFFKGKAIQVMVGFGTGGEDDLWARTISRHLGNHIPGNPTIVVQHMPGSGGLLVANRLYNTAPKDGTAVGMINRGIPFEPLLGGQGAQFDALEVHLCRQSRPRHHGLRGPQGRAGTELAGPVQPRSSPSAAPARAPTPRSIRNSSLRCSA